MALDHISGWFNSMILIRIKSFARATRYVLNVIMFVYRFISSRVHPFWIQFFYFIIIDLFGTLLLVKLKPSDPDFNPRFIDLFFLSTSSLTVSGLATVQMERLSSSQIVVTTLLMLVGGEVFVSMLSVFCRTSNSSVTKLAVSRVSSVYELETIDSLGMNIERIESGADISVKDFSISSLKYLGLIILGYWVFFHVTGFVAFLAYLHIISSSRDVLKGKGINLGLFAFATTVSSFANGGIIATNENMAIFSKNSGLLLFGILLILAGNTLFPLFLRGAIWALRCFKKNDEEIKFMLKNPKTLKFDHLLTNLGTFFRSITVIFIIAVMLILFLCLDWKHPVFDGLNSYQKFVSALFMAINARHAGENSVDCSLISPAVTLFIIFMMYLPSSATFMPLKEGEQERVIEQKENSRRCSAVLKMLIMPQVVCVIIFVIVACITERNKLRSDPLNFSALNVIFEVVSAYGNAGLSTGYACSRLQKLHPDMSCVDQPYSFCGWWSDEGKLLIIVVMLYGRLKSFSKKNGKAWIFQD